MDSSKGQVVIPAEIRKKLEIKPGQRVNLTLVDDKAVIMPLPEDLIKALRGILKGKSSMAQALLMIGEKRLKRKKKLLLDSFVVLAWIQDETGPQLVEDLLYDSQDGRAQVILNIIN